MAEPILTQVEALAIQLAQREGELLQEKEEVKKLANFLKQVCWEIMLFYLIHVSRSLITYYLIYNKPFSSKTRKEKAVSSWWCSTNPFLVSHIFFFCGFYIKSETFLVPYLKDGGVCCDNFVLYYATLTLHPYRSYVRPSTLFNKGWTRNTSNYNDYLQIFLKIASESQ